MGEILCFTLCDPSFFLMIPRPPRSTRPDTLFPYATLFRSRNNVVFAQESHRARIFSVPAAPERKTGEQVDMIAKFGVRSEEHTSELQSLMRISYAVFCLKKTTYPHNKPILHLTVHTCLV